MTRPRRPRSKRQQTPAALQQLVNDEPIADTPENRDVLLGVAYFQSDLHPPELAHRAVRVLAGFTKEES